LRLLPSLVALICATPAWSGAWLREEGTGFVSASALQQQTGETDAALYVEYGLRPKLTLGLMADADMTAGQMGDGTVFVFARKPLGGAERPFEMAYELGIGTTFGHSSDTLLRTGLSYGRGLTVGKRNGWLALDGAVEWSLGDSPDTFKLDTTVGLAVNDRFKVMMQVFLSGAGDATSATLAPSVIWQPKPDRPGYQIGLEYEDDAIALRVGLWKSF